MKKFYWLAIPALILAGCGNSKSVDRSDSTADSVITEESAPVTEETGDYFLTADSIGCIHVGEDISDLPTSEPGLYDMMTAMQTPDAMAYVFSLGNIPQFTIYDFMQGKVDVIALEGNVRGVQTPEGELRVGDEFTKVLKLKGVESEFEEMDDTGIWYWKWNGLYFSVDETDLSDALSQAICEGKRPPRAALFTPDVKIGYIATGLPF